MLRISNTESTEDETRLRLDGRLVGPWVSELMLTCGAVLAKGKQIRIDCAGVTFVDSDGIAALRSLKESTVQLINCSPLLILQLEQQTGWI
jgi:ABC-type transporter Mla MlaB component